MKTRTRPMTRIFALPALIAALSLMGLIGALFLDGRWDPAAAGLLGLAAAAAPLAALLRR